MIILVIYGIILSLLTVCSSSNLRNDQESTHTLSSIKVQLGGPGDNLNNNNEKETYKNWLLNGANNLSNDHYYRPIEQNEDVKKTLEQLNTNPSYANAESFQVQSFNNKYLYQTERPFLNQFQQGRGSFKENQLERGTLNRQELENLGNPITYQESVNVGANFQESPKLRDVNPNAHLLFPKVNKQNDQIAPTLQAHKDYGNQNILDNPFIQNILNKHKPKKGYLVIYPNGTVEHMNTIETLVQNYPNHVLVNLKRNEKILGNTNIENPTNDYSPLTNSKVDTVIAYTRKMDDHSIPVPDILTSTSSVVSNNHIYPSTQKSLTTESSIFTTSSTTESVNKYEPQTTESIYLIGTKHNHSKQPAPVSTTSENTTSTKNDTDIDSVYKKQGPISPTLFPENSNNEKEKELINNEKISTIESTAKKNDHELNNKINLNISDTSSISIENTSTEKINNNQDYLKDTNSAITSKSEKEESDSHEETTIDLEDQKSTTQRSIESSEITEVNSESDVMQCKEEDLATAPNFNQIIGEGQVVNTVYLLHAPMTIVKLLDTDGKSHDCVQIGDPTTPLSYIICSAIT